MEDYLFNARSVHHAILFCHHGLADIVQPSLFLAKSFQRKVGLPVYVFGRPSFCAELKKVIPESKVDQRGLFIVEGAEALTANEHLVRRFAVKLILTMPIANLTSFLPLLNHVDRIPHSEHLDGRVFYLEELATFLFPRTFAPDHYLSKGDSYFSPTPSLQAAAYRKHQTSKTLVMAYPNSGDFDTTLRRVNGVCRYRGNTRCFDPSTLPSYSGKLASLMKVLRDGSFILTQDVRPVVAALEAAGYRQKGAPPLFEEVLPDNGKSYAVQDTNWKTLYTIADVIVASAVADVVNPREVHILEPACLTHLFKSIYFRDAISCRVYLHAAQDETYEAFPNPNFFPSWEKALVFDFANHYVLRRQEAIRIGSVCGAMDDVVEVELDRLVRDRPTITDRIGTRGYVTLVGSTYFFQPDHSGARSDFEKLMEEGETEDVAAAYVLERLDFEECRVLLQSPAKSRAHRAFRRYFLEKCWCEAGYTLWRRDGSLQGVDDNGDSVPPSSKSWSRGVARFRNGLKLLAPRNFTLVQLKAMAESASDDNAELWRIIELKLRRQGLVLTPLQI